MQNQKVKKHILLSDEALAVVERRKVSGTTGEWISQALVDYDNILAGVPVVEDCGTLEQIAARLRSLELMVALLIKRSEEKGG